MSYLRIIGDVHGAISKPRQTIAAKAASRTYLSLIKKNEYSIQLGDMGFNYEKLENVDKNRHFWIGGNHDNYYTLQHSKINGYLGDFGFNTEIENFPFFFVRGAYSIDRQYRIPGISWWEEEELTHLEGIKCIELYDEIRPQIVLSHDCPLSVLSTIAKYSYKTDGSRTNHLLESLLDIHRPKFWIFGHHHRNYYDKLAGCSTTFICIQELMYLDLNEKGEFLNVIGQ